MQITLTFCLIINPFCSAVISNNKGAVNYDNVPDRTGFSHENSLKLNFKKAFMFPTINYWSSWMGFPMNITCAIVAVNFSEDSIPRSLVIIMWVDIKTIKYETVRQVSTSRTFYATIIAWSLLYCIASLQIYNSVATAKTTRSLKSAQLHYSHVVERPSFRLYFIMIYYSHFSCWA